MNGLHWAAVDGAGDAIAITHTCIDAAAKRPLSVQIVLDEAETWHAGSSGVAPDAYDAWGALTHEFAHASLWDGHYAEDDARCTAQAPMVMCLTLPMGSMAWRTLSPLDAEIFASRY